MVKVTIEVDGKVYEWTVEGEQPHKGVVSKWHVSDIYSEDAVAFKSGGFNGVGFSVRLTKWVGKR